MPKIFMSVLWLLVAVSSTWAQSANPIVTLAASGKIRYQAPGYSSKTVLAGALLQDAGTLKLKANSSITLFAEGQFQTIQGPKTTALQTAFPDQGGMMKLNFENTFFDYTLAAVAMAANPEDPKDAWGKITGKKGTGDGWGKITGKKGTGDGWGKITGKKGTGDGWGKITGKKGTGDGWGGKDKVINGIAPFGKIRPGSKTFYWSKPAGATNYQLEIKNTKGAVLFKVTTTDTLAAVPLDPAQFNEGQQYLWQVSGGGVQSEPMVLEIGREAELNTALQRAEKAESYAQNPSSVQGLMRAVALEQGDWYLEADQLYARLQTQEPQNLLIKLMHAAFWLRNGPKPLAEQAFKR